MLTVYVKACFIVVEGRLVESFRRNCHTDAVCLLSGSEFTLEAFDYLYRSTSEGALTYFPVLGDRTGVDLEDVQTSLFIG